MTIALMSLKEAKAFDESFPHRVVIMAYDLLDGYTEWARAELGELAWDDQTYSYKTCLASVYVEARWSYLPDDDGGYAFVFRNETDAIHFKLRWVG